MISLTVNLTLQKSTLVFKLLLLPYKHIQYVSSIAVVSSICVCVCVEGETNILASYPRFTAPLPFLKWNIYDNWPLVIHSSPLNLGRHVSLSITIIHLTILCKNLFRIFICVMLLLSGSSEQCPPLSFSKCIKFPTKIPCPINSYCLSQENATWSSVPVPAVRQIKHGEYDPMVDCT